MANALDPRIAPYYESAAEVLAQSTRIARDVRNSVVRALGARGIEQDELALKASESRRLTGDDFIVVRASLEFSSFCRQRCSFCGMNALNKGLKRYRLNEDQILSIIGSISKLGVKDLHLASGEDWGFKGEALARVVTGAKALGLEVTLVTGHRSVEDYVRFREAGADRYILKVESTNPDVFNASRMGTELRTRVAHLLFLRSLGFKIGTGIICGLPGQAEEDLAGDIGFLATLRPDMASVSRFLPNPESSFRSHPEGCPDTTLNVLSLMRLHLATPGLRIPAGTTLGRRQTDAIRHGANVVSLHVTPEEHADQYSADRIFERHLVEMDEIRNLSAQTGLALRFEQQI